MRRRDFIPLALAAPFAGRAGDASSEDIFTILSPDDYRIYQRGTEGTTGIDIAAYTRTEGFSELRFRLDGGPWRTGTSGEFRNISKSVFGAVAVAPGMHVVDVAAFRAGEIAAQKTIHFGAGEVFVIAGQSNSTNYGEEPQTSETGAVTTFDGAAWRIANDPQPGVQDNSNKGSFIPPFGDVLARRFKVAVGVACVGHGSTSVRQWLPGGERFHSLPTMTRFVTEVEPGTWQSDGNLFDGMAARIGKLGRNGFRAVLWHQGESDAHQGAGHQISGPEYREMLGMVIEESRLKAGWDVPWIVAQASYHNPEDPSDPAIRAAQADMWKSALVFEGPDTDQLGPAYREKNGAGVHFNAKGLQAHGQLWADKVGAYLDRIYKAAQ